MAYHQGGRKSWGAHAGERYTAIRRQIPNLNDTYTAGKVATFV